MSADNRTRMLILGGYLGAGKTTLAVNLAKTLKERRGKSVSIIMNDQGDVLVDTEYSKDAGFDTRDLSGSPAGRRPHRILRTRTEQMFPAQMLLITWSQ